MILQDRFGSKKPKKQLPNTTFEADAANSAADDMAPIVPTTNSRLPSPIDRLTSNEKKPIPSNNTSGLPTGDMDAYEQVEIKPAQSQEQLYSNAISDLLGSGPRDTKEEEALLREQMLRDVGAGQANLNARMAASGFGTSGALSKLGTDMRSDAAFHAANAIQGVRQNARDEYLDRVSAGLGFAGQDRSLDITEANYDAYIKAINEIFGNVPESTSPTGIDDPGVKKVDTETGEDGVIRPKDGYKNPFSSAAEIYSAFQAGQLTPEQVVQFLSELQQGY